MTIPSECNQPKSKILMKEGAQNFQIDDLERGLNWINVQTPLYMDRQKDG